MDITNAVSSRWHIVLFRVLCAVRLWVWSRWWLRCTLLLFVQLFASRASSRCKHDMGTLSWLNVKTLKRVPIPLFDRLFRCSTHGRSFVRLWYMNNLSNHLVTYNNDWLPSGCTFLLCQDGTRMRSITSLLRNRNLVIYTTNQTCFYGNYQVKNWLGIGMLAVIFPLIIRANTFWIAL